jgi:hypothetical protein
MAIVMGLDQHRAQIAAEWIDTDNSLLPSKIRTSLRQMKLRGWDVSLTAAPQARGASTARPQHRRSRPSLARRASRRIVGARLDEIRADAGILNRPASCSS